QWQGDIICFNPGSVSIPKGEYPASYGMLDKGVLQVLTLQGKSPNRSSLPPCNIPCAGGKSMSERTVRYFFY
ncbi:hypothetical protein LXP63_21525, partial [Yersinia pestis subsp. pestis]|nr:hypothetical protein [Yersinia pestis subsp. pestis]